MSKILNQEMKEGIITKIQDDIVIGGDTQMQTAKNYIRVLNKLDLANLRVEPQKVIIFLESADIAGWIWEKGGMLSVSPHRKNSLTNMREHNITKIKHLQSFLGLYKTLQMATPGISRVLAPLKEAVAGKTPMIQSCGPTRSPIASKMPKVTFATLTPFIFLFPQTS